MTKIFAAALLVTLSSVAAQAGSSSTSVACSSVSGKTVIAGILPGQGEVETNIQYSIGSFFRQFDSNSVDQRRTTVELNATQSQVRLNVVGLGDTSFVIESKDQESTKLKRSANGVSGSFIGLLSGTDLRTGGIMSSPIELRCFVSDEI